MRLNRLFSGVPFSPFHLAFSILIYTPVLVLYLHHRETPFSFDAFVVPVLICLASIAAAFVVARASGRVTSFVEVCCGSVALYILLTVNIFPLQSGVLDGVAQPLNKPSIYWHLTLAAACLGVFVLNRKTAVRMLHAIGIFSIIFAGYALLRLAPAPASNITELPQIGRSKNVIILVVDMFQGYFVGNYLDKNPALAAKLDGFTYFDNAASVGPFTTVSTRYLLTGVSPHGETGSTREINQHDNLLADSVRNGYRTNYVSITVPVTLPGVRVYDASTSLTDKKKDYLKFAYASVKRFYPGQLLPQIGPPLELGWVSKTTAKESFQWFTDKLAYAHDVEKTFHYYHNIMTHQPIRFTATGAYNKNLTPDDLYGEIGLALSGVGELIEKLKMIGKYDDTTIIITGDHGYNFLDELHEKTLPAEAHYLRKKIGTKHIGQYNVAIMIKPAGTRGGFRRTGAAVVLSDLRKTVNELMVSGSGSRLSGVDMMQPGLPSKRTVPILAFTKTVFRNEDFDLFDNWKPLDLALPLSAN